MVNPLSILCLLLLALTNHVTISEKTALIVIDVQTCFTSGGTMPVSDGDDVIPVVNYLRAQHESQFDLIVMSQDWHCADHISFASQHDGYEAGGVIALEYNSNGALCKTGIPSRNGSVDCSEVAHRLNQTLWPDHCIMGTADAGLHQSLETSPSDVIIRKGYRCNVDSYSAFFDNGGFTQTELQHTLQNASIDTVFITGLALDYCVFWTAKDANNLGYTTYVVLDATRPIDEAGGAAAVEEMGELGIHVVNSDDVDDILTIY